MTTNTLSYNWYDPTTDLATYGRQQAADINDYYKAAQGQGVQDMTSRGLAGTTLMPSMRLGYARQQSKAMLRLQESLAKLRSDAKMQLQGQQLQNQQFGQNLGYQYAQLAQQQNQYSQSRYNPSQVVGGGYVDMGYQGSNPGGYGSPTYNYYQNLLS